MGRAQPHSVFFEVEALDAAAASAAHEVGKCSVVFKCLVMRQPFELIYAIRGRNRDKLHAKLLTSIRLFDLSFLTLIVQRLGVFVCVSHDVCQDTGTCF